MNFEDSDIKFFNKLVDLAHICLEKGYAKAWFTWIEWISLSVLLYIAGDKLNSFFLRIITFLSFTLVFFVGIVAIEKFTLELVPSIKGKPLVTILISLGINLLGIVVIFEVLTGIIKTIGV